MIHGFQITVLGCHGGPIDTRVSSFLIKSASTPWQRDCLLCVDAGTLISGIIHILKNDPGVFPQIEGDMKTNGASGCGCCGAHNGDRIISGNIQLPSEAGATTREIGGVKPESSNVGGTETEHVKKDEGGATNSPVHLSSAIANGGNNEDSLVASDIDAIHRERAQLISSALYILEEYLSGLYITHEHIDHIAGLVINSPVFSRQRPKLLAAREPCISSLKNYVFNGRIWPNLTNEGPGALNLLKFVHLKAGQTVPDAAVNLSVQPFDISHGLMNSEIDPSTYIVYDSTAYFITDTVTSKVVLIWGDVEPDVLSKKPRNYKVWKAAADYFNRGLLTAVFIECSYPQEREDQALFGHMNSLHLAEELACMSSQLPESRSKLQGLKVFATHIKSDLDDVAGNIPSPHRIINELKFHAEAAGLECDFAAAESGKTYYL